MTAPLQHPIPSHVVSQQELALLSVFNLLLSDCVNLFRLTCRSVKTFDRTEKYLCANENNAANRTSRVNNDTHISNKIQNYWYALPVMN